MTETEKSGKDWNAAIAEIKEKPLVACLIGVGFSAALLGGRTQQDEDAFTSNWLIKKTVKEDKIRKEGDRKEKFPILSWLFGKYPNHADSLNYVWSTKLEYARLVAQYYPQVLKKYLDKNTPLPLINLTEFLKKRGSFIHTVNSLLGTELRRMLALRYSHTEIINLINPEQGRKEISETTPFNGLYVLRNRIGSTSWISLNYDTALEAWLHRGSWRYWFHDLLVGSDSSPQAKHIVVKPHGSLNVWFRTDWPASLMTLWPPEKREAAATHLLAFCSQLNPKTLDIRTEDTHPLQLLCTCDEKLIGCQTDPVPDGTTREIRPWIVGYLPDEMKKEINSPGQFADPAHDLCKANVAYAGLTLGNADAIFILGYSMPPEDKWLWNRLESLSDMKKEKMSIYVASRWDTCKIINRLRLIGFKKAYCLNEGRIENKKKR